MFRGSADPDPPAEMNRSKSSSSSGSSSSSSHLHPSGSSSSSTSSVASTSASAAKGFGQEKVTDTGTAVVKPPSRKRPYPSSNGFGSALSSSTSLDQSSSLLLGSTLFLPTMSSDGRNMGDFTDFTCPICMEVMSEPSITFCGHTYCKACLLKTIETGGRCPKCGMHLTKDKFCPNFALSDVITRTRIRAGQEVIKAEVLESIGAASSSSTTTTPHTDVVECLTGATSYEQLNLNDLDRLLLVLQRRREIMASEDEQYKRKLLQEFLKQLLKIKNAHMEQLSREISLINRDLHVARTSGVNCGGNNGDTSGVSGASIDTDPASNGEEDMEMSGCSSSSTPGPSALVGFNTQPLRNVQMDHQSLSSRKSRLYRHFDELTQVYFETRHALMFDTRIFGVDDATVPNNGPQPPSATMDDEDLLVLRRFGRTLSQITQYHDLKPLATLNYDNSDDDMMPSNNSNIVSSIEFDKDNEFFAIAGVTKKIKLFEYVNVIGCSVNVHCPSVELVCKAKISCVAWSNYYKNSLASSDYDGNVILWDVSTGSQVSTMGEHEKRVWSVDWSNGDPRLLASGSDDGKVRLWSTNQERSVANLEVKANVCCVQFCPVNTYTIAFGSADHRVHYYDFRNTREPLGMLYGHKKAVSYVKFAGRNELVSASTDSHLKLWNLDQDSMSCVKSFTGHVNDKNFVGLDIAVDGGLIACGSENNSLYIYHKFLPKPLFSFKFERHGRGILSGLDRGKSGGDDSGEFISAVAWKTGSPIVLAANSQGLIKILELV